MKDFLSAIDNIEFVLTRESLHVSKKELGMLKDWVMYIYICIWIKYYCNFFFWKSTFLYLVSNFDLHVYDDKVHIFMFEMSVFFWIFCVFKALSDKTPAVNFWKGEVLWIFPPRDEFLFPQLIFLYDKSSSSKKKRRIFSEICVWL